MPRIISSTLFIFFVFQASGCGLREDSLLCTGRELVETANNNSPSKEDKSITRTFGFYLTGNLILVDETSFFESEISRQEYMIRGVKTDPYYAEFSIQKDTGLLRYKTSFTAEKITRKN